MLRETYMNDSVLADFERSMGDEGSFWHDYNLDVASEILDQFSADTWSVLNGSVFVHPQYWQERCAESIGYRDNENGIEVLITLLQSPQILVAAIAASELDNMSVRLPKSFSNRLSEILDELMKQKSSRCEDIKNLICRLE